MILTVEAEGSIRFHYFLHFREAIPVQPAAQPGGPAINDWGEAGNLPRKGVESGASNVTIERSMNTNDAVIGGDWGTSNLRLYWIDRESESIVDSLSCDQGVKPLANQPERFAAVLAEQCQALKKKVGATSIPGPVLISGMASSSVGWHEIPYGTLPFDLSARSLPRQQVVASDGTAAILFSGIAAEMDVMRGEECECIGLHALLGADAPAKYKVILPGTHSKHVSVENGKMNDFSTFFGGELFAILADHSILRMSMQQDGSPAPGQDLAAFADGVRTGAKENLLGQLFKVRARSLLLKASPLECREWLNGLLIGAELKEQLDSDPAIPVFCLGAARLRTYYTIAAQTLGLAQWRNLDDEQMLSIRTRLYLQLALH